MDYNLEASRIAEVEVRTVGVDLDGHDGLRLLRAYYNARRFGEVLTYYTKHGFHLVVTLRESLPRWRTLDVRACIGDDPDRLHRDEMDLDHGYYHRFDRLFETRYKDGGRYTRWPFEVVR